MRLRARSLLLTSVGLLAVTLIVALLPIAGAAQVPEGNALLEHVRNTMAEVQSGKTVNVRTDAAEHLASLTKKISKKEITESLVSDLTSLLDSPDDSVRYWVATALGNLGPAAKAAVPKLEKLLSDADCLNGAITSASGIRYSLMRMGVKPPPPPKCGRVAG
jgi:hypothetical protein